MKKDLLSKLDLTQFIENFNLFLARKKPLFIEGDVNIHFQFIKELSKYDFNSPKEIKNLDTELMHLKKQGTLKIYEIYEFVKIVEYFLYLKKINFSDEITNWLKKITIPDEIVQICQYFDDKGKLQDKIDERFLAIRANLKSNKESIKSILQKLISSPKISDFLVDRQIHYIDENETLLLRGGFNHVIKGSVSARSSGGFFYVIPDSILNLKKQQASLLSQYEELINEYEKSISKTFTKFEPFLKFLNKEFDRFDHYQARIFFAKSKNLEFVKPKKTTQIVLHNFAHPALHDPKPISINFSKKILMLTGVNAGGKTMFLKSILSAVFLAKYLLPMKINSFKSQIGSFKEILAIIDDPQNVKNDISTFAGRMISFSKLFSKNSFIVGVDEIELGTDADEAASLFKVILEKLLIKDVKIVITTHHKRLAAMMATNENVSLAAAMFDEKNQTPTFEFLHGTIGKSYAFETALRYNIPANIIKEAKEVYGKDKEKLNELIQKNIDLELKTRKKQAILDKNIQKYQKLNESLKNQKEKSQNQIKELKYKLEIEYQKAIQEAKKAAKSNDLALIHRLLNKAHKKKEQIKDHQIPQEKIKLKVGDRIKYQKNRGTLVSLKKDEAMIEIDGIKLRVPISQIKRSSNHAKSKKQDTKIEIQKPKSSSIKLDLHGLRSDEAIEKLDQFLSNALIVGYNEVLIYHGIGSGKLAFAVKEFLKLHPKIVSFMDAPPNMGGFGATLVKL